MFALIDCNNFYASCERVFQPHLNGKPVVILSNNDGCVIARSNEAKSLGIPMGAPAFKYKEVFQKNKVQIFSSNFTLYGDISNRVMSIISRYVPDVEIYSIDEAFIKFDGFSEDETNEKCRDIIKTILKWTGIPVSIGLAPTKSLAKVANRIAKKYFFVDLPKSPITFSLFFVFVVCYFVFLPFFLSISLCFCLSFKVSFRECRSCIEELMVAINFSFCQGFNTKSVAPAFIALTAFSASP